MDEEEWEEKREKMFSAKKLSKSFLKRK